MATKHHFWNLISPLLGARGSNMIFYGKWAKFSLRQYVVCCG